MSPTTTPAANAHRLSASTGSRFRDDRGSMTVLAAMFMIVIVLIVAALIDGEAIRATRRHAGDVAQEAARAAAQQVDTDARFSSSPTITIDVADATAAGTAVLNRAGASSGTVSVDGTEVTVTATFETGTNLLGTRGVAATRTASAERTP